ncbi:MAG: thioredoxin domain-containing protein [Bdellovibrionales bacterium]|nr:thioredoxin domain-containing protein [Bdellovibrionales bacterium]
MSLSNVSVFLLSLLFLTACDFVQDAIQRTLNEHPDIIAKVLNDHPEILEKQMAQIRETESKSDALESEKKLEEQAAQEEMETTKQRSEKKNPLISADRVVFGDRNSKIEIVIYSDFQCPYCARGYKTIKELQKKYGRDLHVVFKHFPIRGHKYAQISALYFEAIAASDSKLAEEFHDMVFENQSELVKRGEDFLTEVTRKIGANVGAVKKMVKSEKGIGQIMNDESEARSFGIRGTPGFVINGHVLLGALPIEEFEALIHKN